MEAEGLHQEGRRLAVEPECASTPDWRRGLSEAIRDPRQLLERLGLSDHPGLTSAAAHREFPLLVTADYLEAMRPGDPTDPLLRQVLPVDAEVAQDASGSLDPLAEAAATVVPGLLRKYRSRALLVATGACAIHCRYCFRRHYPYQDLPRGREWWRAGVEAVAADQRIDEVILSGGDPLVLDDALLERLVAAFAGIPHLKRLRIHSRLPVVLPDRITGRLLGLLTAGPQQGVLMIHANHARELTSRVRSGLDRCRRAGVLVLNQAVLLAGVNDSVAAQAELAEALASAGALPCYLHQLDAVRGAAHFAVSDALAFALMRELHARLPGYLLPRLVRELPGDAGKTHLAWWS